MKVEIKRIGILNVIFSVFPVAVFVVMLISSIVNMFSPDVTFNLSFLMNMIMSAIISTLLFLVFTVFFLLAYNILCGIGIRGVCVELEDKE
ncbi:MAG TPA: hypothetical protein IAB21_01565 [Candidatus Avelusimicrobium excrementipullorum]|nr:hypothetical protein [Candidatus Avelusimicrobium excrementipullorum]